MAFTIGMSSPLQSGFTQGFGGPGVGGHVGPNWYISAGMDLGADVGSEVRAAFDAHITRYSPHNPSTDTRAVFGAQIFMRSQNDKMGGFYTHITDVPAAIKMGGAVSRGDLLGKVYSNGATSPHLHTAVVEIIGGAPGGRYMGVSNLYGSFQSMSNTAIVKYVTFQEDGSQPDVP